MAPVQASDTLRPASARAGTSAAEPAAPDPSVLREMMARNNAAATIPAGNDHAIWEDACRRLATDPRAVRAVVPAGPKTVILVDDSSAVRETMHKALATAGYRVLSAEDGAKGLAMARQQKADLVITDVEMPTMDGIAFISQLRELSTQRFTPIMMLTTATQDGHKIAGRRAGATGWIAKPFDPQRFIAIVQKVCPAG